MKRVLVLGGTGFVGRHVCEKLAEQGWAITVPTRRLPQARAVQMLPGLTVLQADVHDPAALAQLLPGHDAVVNLVAILHGNEAAFEQVHVRLPTQLAQAALHSGVKRLVHVSALGVPDGDAASAPSMYLRSKARGEAALRAAQAQGLQLTLLRPSVIFGADDRFLNLFADLQRLAPVLPLAGAAARFQPVWVEDVACAVRHCLQDARTTGQTYELCGPAIYTLKQLAQLAGGLRGYGQGRGRPVIALPEALARLQAWVMEHLPGPTLMSRDNLDSMKADNIASGRHPGLTALGVTPGSLLALAPSYLGTDTPQHHLDRWRSQLRR